MRESKWALGHSYRIVMADDGMHREQILEFEARGSDVALFRAQKYCPGRDLEMFEDGRSLGHMRCQGDGGFWLLTPPHRASRSPVAEALAHDLLPQEAAG